MPAHVTKVDNEKILANHERRRCCGGILQLNSSLFVQPDMKSACLATFEQATCHLPVMGMATQVSCRTTQAGQCSRSPCMVQALSDPQAQQAARLQCHGATGEHSP
jgi:hypothetical protein